MTRLYEKVRRENKFELGFGVEVMKTKKICTKCGAAENASQSFCRDCGTPLPEETLFEVYAKRHRRCGACGTVASKDMNYCPLCGNVLPPKISKSVT